MFALTTAKLVTSASAAPPSVRSRVRGAVVGGFVGDALSLESHYEYDAKVIAGHFTRPAEFGAPRVNYGVGWGRANYHPGKLAGDMTDAGDVALMLLEHVALEKRYTFDAFAQYWHDQILPPDGSPGYGRVALRRHLFEALTRLPAPATSSPSDGTTPAPARRARSLAT